MNLFRPPHFWNFPLLMLLLEAAQTFTFSFLSIHLELYCMNFGQARSLSLCDNYLKQA